MGAGFRIDDRTPARMREEAVPTDDMAVHISHSPAPRLESVVDSLGAGDMFDAPMGNALSIRRTMVQRIAHSDDFGVFAVYP